MIVGESGVGKELISTFIHTHSARRNGPHVRVNMAACPASMIEAQLFGSVRGAFTDARQDRAGLFGSADGGTVLLDEVCELGIEQQPKLLRVLEEQRYFPVGSDSERRVDVRVLAATNRNPEDEISAGRLRADLYYRLSSVVIRVPPLRARREDIPALADYFLQEFAIDFGVQAPAISSEARQQLLAYPWPGNVRELRNVIEQAVMFCDDHIIGPEHLAFSGTAPHAPAELCAPVDDGPVLTLREALEAFERTHIERSMTLAGGSATRAAQMLGLARSTLWEKRRRYLDKP
jgi:transcriptional regulator with PAS, ATPase and Fis domain